MAGVMEALSDTATRPWTGHIVAQDRAPHACATASPNPDALPGEYAPGRGGRGVCVTAWAEQRPPAHSVPPHEPSHHEDPVPSSIVIVPVLPLLGPLVTVHEEPSLGPPDGGFASANAGPDAAAVSAAAAPNAARKSTARRRAEPVTVLVIGIPHLVTRPDPFRWHNIGSASRPS